MPGRWGMLMWNQSATITAPTFVAEYEMPWNISTSPQTVSVTTAVGDRLVAVAATADSGTLLNTPTGGTSLTWTLQRSSTVSANCAVYLWTATATTAETFTFSLAHSSGTDAYGANVLRFSGSGGFGASSVNNSTGGPSLDVTTTQDNSLVVGVFGDWNAADGTTRTWRTINSVTPTSGNGGEKTYFRLTSTYTVYAAIWSNVGTAGLKTTGLSAPTGMKWAGIALEVKGT